MEAKKAKKKNTLGESYIMTKHCGKCGMEMKYAYGETYVCPGCGEVVLTDFGKVKQYLDANGPQPAIIISEKTGVPIDYINKMLREGRIEIPDGSEIYIKCESCGTDIRYGRFCPECMQKIVKNLNKALWMPEVGERPKIKNNTGKMRTVELLNRKRQ